MSFDLCDTGGLEDGADQPLKVSSSSTDERRAPRIHGEHSHYISADMCPCLRPHSRRS